MKYLHLVLAILWAGVLGAQPSKNLQPTDSKAHLIVQLKDFEKQPVAKADVWLETVDGKRVAEGRTNKGGIFETLVPNGTTYWVGVEDSARYAQVTIEKKPYVITRRTVFFQGNVNGKVSVPAAPAFTMMPPPDGMAFVEITFIDYAYNPIEGEEVTLKALGSGKEFKGSSDAEGKVVLKVPIGENYRASVKYIQNLETFNFPAHGGSYNVRAKYGITSSVQITEARRQRVINDSLYNLYRQATLEEQRKLRDADLHKTLFAPVGVTRAVRTPEVQHAERSYVVPLAEAGGGTGFVHGPIAVDNLLICTAPWADSHIYAFDLETGAKKWAAKLGEGGPCAAAASGGYVVVVTESCTIYVLKQATGELAWSGYLSPYVLSAAALSDGKAFVAYDDSDVTELDPQRFKSNHALACFDLATGKPVWQQWVNGECMSSPVVDEGKVFLNTFTGYSYVVDALTGKLLASAQLFGSSAPTHKAGRVYMSQRNPSESSFTERIAVFSAKDLSLLSATPWAPAPYLTPEGSVSRQGAQAQASASLLNGLAEEELRDAHSMQHAKRLFGASTVLAMQYFQGSRPVLSGDQIYVAMGNTLRCLKTSNLEEVWRKTASVTDPQGRDFILPLVAGGKVIATQSDGKVSVLDSSTGAVVIGFDLGAQVVAPPIVWKGWLVGATTTGKVLAIRTGDGSLDGWGQWGGGASRNSAR